MRVTLNGLDFSHLDDHPMALWKCTALDGWDSPELRQTILNRAGRHGGRVGDSYHGVRKMVLTGKAFAKPGYTADQLADELSRITNLVTAAALLVVHETAPKQCQVHRAGEPIIRRPTNTRLEFDIPLLAQDPIKYSTTVRETVITVGVGARAASAALVNAGNTPVEPHEIIVAGAGTAPITLTRVDRSHTIRLTAGLGGSNRYVIDAQERSVKYGPSGSEKHRYRYVARDPRWWTIPPAGCTVQAKRSTASGTMDVTIRRRDGWM